MLLFDHLKNTTEVFVNLRKSSIYSKKTSLNKSKVYLVLQVSSFNDE